MLQRVPGVDLVEDVRLYRADPVTGERTDATAKIPLDPHALAFSYEHQLRVQGGLSRCAPEYRGCRPRTR
ncbi:hypothetical protein SCALM49S_04478 [Streptomyces californicus]